MRKIAYICSMENNVEFLDELKAEVLHLFGEELKSSAAFERFSAAIEQTTGSSLSVFTLKRLFGQMKTDGSPSINTLSILARYAGYAGWGDFVAQHCPSIKDETIAPPKKRRPNYLVGAISALFVLLAAGLLLLVIGHSPKNPNEVTGTIVAEDNTLTWTLDKSTWALSISGQGKMKNFQQHGMPDAWLAYRDSLCSVVIGEGVLSVGNYAFSFCKRLQSVILPNSLLSIGNGSFAYCNHLTALNLPEGLDRLGAGAFKGCHRLREIELPSGITELPFDLFASCSHLESCTFLGDVTSMDREVFAHCHSLKRIDLPSSMVSVGSSCFADCKSLEELVVPEGVKFIDEYAFQKCTSLNRIVLPSTMTSISNRAFDFCNHLQFIESNARQAPRLGEDVFADVPSSVRLIYPQGADYTSWKQELYRKR